MESNRTSFLRVPKFQMSSKLLSPQLCIDGGRAEIESNIDMKMAGRLFNRLLWLLVVVKSDS